MTIRVVVVDDQDMVRAGIAALLGAQPDIEVVGEAADGAAALAEADRTQPAVVVMDIRMPGMDGLTATRKLTGGPKVLVLTTFDADEYVYRALQAGASGFLLKGARPAELAEAVRIVAAGEALLAPSVTRRLIEQVVSAGLAPSMGPPGRPGLTKRGRRDRAQAVVHAYETGLVRPGSP